MKENPTTPLVGILVCAECGRALVGGLSRSHTGARHGYYRCPQNHCSVPFARAEEAVAGMLARLAGCADFLALVRANLSRLAEIGFKGEAAKVEAARASVARNEARVKRAREAFLEGAFTADEYREARADADLAIREARIVLDTHAEGAARRGALVDALIDIVARPERVLRLPPAPLRDALRAVFGALRVTSAKTIEPDKDSVFELLVSAQADESKMVELFARLLNREDGLERAAAALRA